MDESGMTKAVNRPAVTFLTTPSMPCPYIEGRVERKILTSLNSISSPRLLQALSLAGFRRSHHLAYAPSCHGCDACVSVRVVVDEFTLSRSQSRIWKRNGGYSASEQPALATEEQYSLFKRYIDTRHGEGDMAGMSESDYVFMIEDTPVETRVIEFRDDKGNLAAACLMDKLPDGLSAVYSFFDPDREKDGLGNYMILWLIERARVLNLPYVYLGYWIADCAKMTYKTRFQPLEGLRAGKWGPIKTGPTG